eukprot:4780038-Alexandrium_andersonii.AAC.1
MAAGANGYVAKTVDSGRTWTVLSVFPSTSYTSQYNTISVMSISEVYVAARADAGGSVVYHTLDGGVSWTLFASTDL